MRTYIGVVLAAIGLLSVSVAAQDAQEKKTYVEARGNVVPVPLPPGGPAPRMSDGHVDFSGVWFSGPTGKANAWSVVREEPERQAPIPYQPWLDAKLKALTPAERQLTSPQVTCKPLGVPGMWTNNPYPHQIVMKPGIFVHLIESNNNWRVVYTDRKEHVKPEEREPLYNGDSTVRWEGDTLVIDTISLDERNWHTDSLHVVERFRRPNKNYLEYQYTLDDPKALTKPWTSNWRTYSLGSEPLIENFCTNNENVEQLERLAEQTKAK